MLRIQLNIKFQLLHILPLPAVLQASEKVNYRAYATTDFTICKNYTHTFQLTFACTGIGKGQRKKFSPQFLRVKFCMQQLLVRRGSLINLQPLHLYIHILRENVFLRLFFSPTINEICNKLKNYRHSYSHSAKETNREDVKFTDKTIQPPIFISLPKGK